MLCRNSMHANSLTVSGYHPIATGILGSVPYPASSNFVANYPLEDLIHRLHFNYKSLHEQALNWRVVR
jgi:hypothetical protein